MEIEILKLLKKGKKIKAIDLVNLFGCYRQKASTKLSSMERKYDNIHSRYKQEQLGNRIYTIKYYFWKKK